MEVNAGSRGLSVSQRLIRRLASVSVQVPTLDETVAFLRDILEFVHIPGPVERMTLEGEYGLDPPRHVLSLVAGERLALAGIIFEVADEVDLKVLTEGLAAAGIDPTPVPADDGGGDGIAFRDPFGIEVMCRVPAAPAAVALPPSVIRPRRLGHVNLKVPDAALAAAFYTETLGLRLSESVGDLLRFLRVHGDHHNLGFRGGADEAGVHHVAFEVSGWESFRVVCDHLAARGHVVEYGPGRHGPGHNLFLYLRDPASGLRIELFADMAHIDDEEGYQPKQWSAGDRARTVNQWGPAPPKSFLE